MEGSVPIDVSPIADDPEATIRKMQKVRRAALAPAQPSAADRSIGSHAAREEQKARVELSKEESPPDAEGGNAPKEASAGAEIPSSGTPASSEESSVRSPENRPPGERQKMAQAALTYRQVAAAGESAPFFEPGSLDSKL